MTSQILDLKYTFALFRDKFGGAHATMLHQLRVGQLYSSIMSSFRTSCTNHLLCCSVAVKGRNILIGIILIIQVKRPCAYFASTRSQWEMRKPADRCSIPSLFDVLHEYVHRDPHSCTVLLQIVMYEI